MFVKVVFAIGEAERLLVPAEAVLHRSEVTAVYVVELTRAFVCGRSAPASILATVLKSCRAWLPVKQWPSTRCWPASLPRCEMGYQP